MKGRLKFPAFGRALFKARKVGDHPSRIWVIYGDDWSRRPKNAPTLCVGSDFEPRSIDWRVVAAVPTHIVWRNGEQILELVAEVAAHAAPVVVHWLGSGEWPHEEGQPYQDDAARFLAGASEVERGKLERAWLWWQDKERDYQQRCTEYREALVCDMAGDDGQAA